MEQKIRIGAVSYLNTKPMITGLEDWNAIEITLDYPANIAKMLLQNEIDIGLVPVAIVPQLKNVQYISNFGIACNGAVASVCLFSEVPIQKIETIILDYQSKTSVQLLKILVNEFWKIKVKFINGTKGFEHNVAGTTAALVIGDRAFDLALKHTYIYDLGEAWFQHTKLPFVFARWISNKTVTNQFINLFSLKIEENIIDYYKSKNFIQLPKVQQHYLEKIIQYHLTDNYKSGLSLFLNKINLL